MDNPQFNVVVDGTVLPTFEAAAVSLSLQQHLKLPPAKAQLLIAGKTVTVKRAVDAAIADAYCKRLRDLGVNARVENSGVTPEPSLNEAAPATTRAAENIQTYFSPNVSGARNDIPNSAEFARAVARSSLIHGGVALGYGLLAALSIAALSIYMVRYASFLVVPPIIFSATVYFTVSFALAVIAALLLRPFLPRTDENVAPTLLAPMQAPALFSFVAQLCERLTLQPPAQIALTTASGNSASLLAGLGHFRRGEYRLTLSLPLLENSSLAEFAGALAADLATQANPAMLRYRAVADEIHGRLADCLARRDRLAQRIAALLATAPRAVGRLIVLADKIVEHNNEVLKKVAAYLAQADAQMQQPSLYEQDRYNALIAGSESFAARMILRARIEAAARDAGAKNTEDRIDGGLVDDLPALIKHYYDSADANVAQAIQRAWNAEPTPRRDEPPIMRERIERIAATSTPSVIAVDGPAVTLLPQRDELARIATLDNYRAYDLSVDPSRLMPVDELTYAATQDILQRQQAIIYFNDWFRPFRFWGLADYQLIGDMPLQDAAAQLSVCVNEIRRLSPDRSRLLAEYERLHNQLHEILLAQHVLAAGKKFAFRYLRYDGTTLAPILEERQREIAMVMDKLSQQEAVMGGRITLGLRLSGQADHEVRDLHDALRLMHDIGGRLYKLSLDCFQLEHLLQRQHETDYSLPIKKLETKIEDACTLLIVRLNDIPYPLDSRHRSLKSFVETAFAQPLAKPASTLRRAKRLLDVLYRVNEKLSRQAAEYGGIAEEAYRIEPIRLIGAK